jgi:hypothetical protein
VQTPLSAAAPKIEKPPVQVQKPMHDIEVKETPALKALLSSLSIDDTPKDSIAEPEKPLKEVIPPVKYAERGPSQKNKDLLRQALGNALNQEKKPSVAPAPKPNPAPAPKSAAPSGEIEHEELKKVLE